MKIFLNEPKNLAIENLHQNVNKIQKNKTNIIEISNLFNSID